VRYVLLSNLKPGMTVARPFYNKNLNILLNEGMTLSEKHLISLDRIGLHGIYVHDEFSTGIKLATVIDDKSKMVFAGAVNNVFEGVGKTLPPDHGILKDVIKDLVGQVSDNRDTVVNMLDLKQFDDYTFQHSLNVCILSIVVGVQLELSGKALESLALAAVYHDIGKLKVPHAILNKPGRLDEKEFEMMRQHPALGVEYLKSIGELNTFIEMGVLQHHERYDGSGYPKGLKGKQISEFARIISIVDAFDAITSKRSYKDSFLPSEAIEYIMANVGLHFDYDITKVFLTRILPYPDGISVELSNGLRGVVVKNHEVFPMRPVIKIIPKNVAEPSFLLDLSSSKAITITITRIIE